MFEGICLHKRKDSEACAVKECLGPCSPQSFQNGVHNTIWESLDIVCLMAEDAFEISFSIFLSSHWIYLLGDSPWVCLGMCTTPSLDLCTSTQESTLEIKWMKVMSLGQITWESGVLEAQWAISEGKLTCHDSGIGAVIPMVPSWELGDFLKEIWEWGKGQRHDFTNPDPINTFRCGRENGGHVICPLPALQTHAPLLSSGCRTEASQPLALGWAWAVNQECKVSAGAEWVPISWWPLWLFFSPLSLFLFLLPFIPDATSQYQQCRQWGSREWGSILPML